MEIVVSLSGLVQGKFDVVDSKIKFIKKIYSLQERLNVNGYLYNWLSECHC